MTVFVTRPISGTSIGLCVLLLAGMIFSAWRGRHGETPSTGLDLPKPPIDAAPAGNEQSDQTGVLLTSGS